MTTNHSISVQFAYCVPMNRTYQYTLEVTLDGYRYTYDYYTLDNGEWLVDSDHPKIKIIEVSFDKIITPTFTKDITKLKEYNYDVRQIMIENSLTAKN